MGRILDKGPEPWMDFVVQHGWRAEGYELAHVLGRSAKEIDTLRHQGVCVVLEERRGFAQLFALWHGRAPVDADWPAPRSTGRGTYVWQQREDALLATLVGQLSVPDIAATLTRRLQTLTGDPSAVRGRNHVLCRLSRLGLQAGDLVGGISVVDAGREINSVTTVRGAINFGQLKPFRVGHRLLIPRDQWNAWKASRTFPPKGFVPLASLRERLGIRSDSKLPEFAKAGYVPTAVQCNPHGVGKGSKFGSWFVDPKVARKLVADRHAGRPMPWHGKPFADNLKATWKLLQQRQHPATCTTCATIWGPAGPPATFDDFVRRYPPLAHGAKRHLTMVFSLGLSVDEVAAQAGRKRADVLAALRSGALRSTMHGKRHFITKTDATRWIARKCPLGDGDASWASVELACRLYMFTPSEIQALIANGTLRTKVGTNGPMRGVTYVLKQQCAHVRESQGFTDEEGARRLGITVARLQQMLKGVNWRQAPLIPLVTLQAIKKRLESQEGYDLPRAAAELGQPLQWVLDRVADGTVRVARAPWDRRRRYLSGPQFRRLQAAVDAPPKVLRKLPPTALTLDQAALDAGVSITMVRRWADAGEIELIQTASSPRYPRKSLRARALTYWKTARWRRDLAPRWTDQTSKEKP